MSYVGVPPFGQSTRTISEKIAAQDQVDFYPDGGYLPGYIDVIANGQELLTTDFTALDGVKVTLKNKRGANDEIRMIAYWPVSLVDTYRKSEAVAKAGDTLIGALNEAHIATLASAATVAIGAATANTITITGTTTITAFDTIAAGAVRRLVFAGALTLTHNATSLILPSGASITTAAGDVAEFVSLGSGNWRCFNYMKANGQAVVAPAAGVTSFAGLTGAVDPTVIGNVGNVVFGHYIVNATTGTNNNAYQAYGIGTAIAGSSLATDCRATTTGYTGFWNGNQVGRGYSAAALGSIAFPPNGSTGGASYNQDVGNTLGNTSNTISYSTQSGSWRSLNRFMVTGYTSTSCSVTTAQWMGAFWVRYA